MTSVSFFAVNQTNRLIAKFRIPSIFLARKSHLSQFWGKKKHYLMRGLRGLWRLRGRTGGTTVLLLWRLLLATRALGRTVRGRWQMRLTAGARAGRGRWPRPHWFVLQWKIKKKKKIRLVCVCVSLSWRCKFVCVCVWVWEKGHHWQ